MIPRRRLRDQSLTVSFLNPWKSLAETTIAVRNTAEVSHRSAKWWRLLDEVRTFFDEHPEE